MDANSSNILSIASAISAVASAIYAWRSKRIASQALSIAQKEYDLKKDNLSLYLVDGFKFVSQTSEDLLLAFHTTVTNHSITSNSVEKVELVVSFLRKDGSLGSIALPHDKSLLSRIKSSPLTTFQAPFQIAPKSANSNWSLFNIPHEIFSPLRIEKYTLRITDSAGNMPSVDSYLLNERRDV